MCVVHEAVEDGVGDGRVGDQLVPVLDGELAGHDRRASAVAVIDDLQQIAGLILADRGEAPVVEDQQIDARQGLEQARQRPACRDTSRVRASGRAR